MAIVTISYEMGTPGPEIGMTLARRLKFRYVDHELISEAARRYGLAEDRLSHLDETKPSLFERFDVETRRYITVIQTVFYEFAGDDDVVLMGRGGQWLLRGIPHALRVRVTAPFDVRVKRLVEDLSRQTGTRLHPKNAAQIVQRDDAVRIGRMRYLYEVDLRDPLLYDVTINAHAIGTEAAVGLLADLVGHPSFARTEAGTQLVADRVLASRVEVALATHPDTRRHRITVEARQGVVTVEGAAALERTLEVAREVPGVRDIRIRPVEIPPIPPFVA